MTRPAADARVAARHRDIPQDSLLGDDEVEVVERVKRKKKHVKPFAYDSCPTCTDENVAQRLENGVLTWGLHNRSTIGGTSWPCATSGTPVMS